MPGTFAAGMMFTEGFVTVRIVVGVVHTKSQIDLTTEVALRMPSDRLPLQLISVVVPHVVMAGVDGVHAAWASRGAAINRVPAAIAPSVGSETVVVPFNASTSAAASGRRRVGVFRVQWQRCCVAILNVWEMDCFSALVFVMQGNPSVDLGGQSNVGGSKRDGAHVMDRLVCVCPGFLPKQDLHPWNKHDCNQLGIFT
jgi:hypothetical protein